MNMLDNGSVLPSGLLSSNNAQEMVVGFNRSYRNTSLKAGIVLTAYAANNQYNKTGLCTEYDVQVIEQFEDKGTTSQIYRNCLSSQGLGSIADFLEYTLRQKTQQSSQGTPSFKGQDGAIVLLLCLDGVGEKAVIVGNLIHPDRPTTITSTEPQFSTEYNGVNIQIGNDGACSLTFKGSTDNKGNPTTSNGNTVFQIKADGSFEFKHSTVDILADKSGALTINAKGDANITVGGDSNVTTSGDTNLTTTGKTTIKSKEIDLNGNISGMLTNNSSFGVVDMITGLPLQPSKTIFGDV